MKIIPSILGMALCLASLIQPNAYGTNCYDCCPYFNGCYAGIAGGAVLNVTTPFYDSSYNALGSFLLPNTIINRNDDPIYQHRGWGEIYAGWGHQWSRLYLGGRLGVNFSSFNLTQHNIAQVNTRTPIGFPGPLLTTNVSQKSTISTKLGPVEFTFDVKPGLVFNRTMFFGLIGGAVNKERVTFHSEYLLTSTSPEGNSTIPLNLNLEKEGRGVAFRWGVGLEHFFTKCIALEALYVHTKYWNLNDELMSTTLFTLPLPVTLNQFDSFASRPKRHVISLGLSCYF